MAVFEVSGSCAICGVGFFSAALQIALAVDILEILLDIYIFLFSHFIRRNLPYYS